MKGYTNFSGGGPNSQFDVVVVGSGPSGVHAAYPLVKAGLRVGLIDGGLDSKKQYRQHNIFSNTSFIGTSHAHDLIRESDYVFQKTHELLKIKSKIEIIQSLAKGGLSEIWHGISDYFSSDELDTVGLPVDEIKREYQEISKRINLTATTPLDFHSRLLLARAKNKTHFKSKVYRAPLVFSYRTSSTIEELKCFKNFVYLPNQLVFKVKQNVKQVEIQSFSIDKHVKFITYANFLILAAGSVNTTRILLRSFELYNYKTSFLTKANYVIACFHLMSLLKKNKIKKSRYGQLVIASQDTDQGLDTFFIQLYRFNPRVLHKALQYIHLPKIIAKPVFSIFAPSVVIADVRFPCFESKKAFCMLKKGAGEKDTLEIQFQESSEELRKHKDACGKIFRQLKSLGLFPVHTIFGYTTSHYAGGVPFQHTPGKLSIDSDGKLHQAQRIYVADSSSWRALPAKPPTLTIMANASRVGKNVLIEFNRFRTS